MSALLESLAQGFAGDAAGRATLDAVLREGLPKPRSEAWKYTSLRALERRANFPYQWNFVRNLKARMRRKAKLFPDLAESAEFTRLLNRTWTRFTTGK